MTEFEQLGALLHRLIPQAGGVVESRLGQVWTSCVGEDTAQNARPLSLRGGRLVVATSSPAWAQALQLMEGEIVDRLNRALASASRGKGSHTCGDPISRVQFRAAGWTGGARVGEAASEAGVARRGRAVARGVGGTERGRGSGPLPGRGTRKLSPELEAEVRAVQLAACDATLGNHVAAAMRAWLGGCLGDEPPCPGLAAGRGS